MSEALYTVFLDGDCWQDSDEACGFGLSEIVQWCVKEGHVPVAWCEGSAMGRVKQARIESVLANRVFDLVDGKYVARGLPPTLDKMEAEKEEAKGTSFADLVRSVHAVLRPKHIGVDWGKELAADPNAAMIARDDTVVARHWKLDQIEQYREEPAPESTAKPANEALTRLSAQGHRLGNFVQR